MRAAIPLPSSSLPTSGAGAGERAKWDVGQRLGSEVVGEEGPQEAERTGEEKDHRRSKLVLRLVGSGSVAMAVAPTGGTGAGSVDGTTVEVSPRRSL
jgi:hypothetical protein